MHPIAEFAPCQEGVVEGFQHLGGWCPLVPELLGLPESLGIDPGLAEGEADSQADHASGKRCQAEEAHRVCSRVTPRLVRIRSTMVLVLWPGRKGISTSLPPRASTSARPTTVSGV